MPGKVKDLTGLKVGRLTVVRFISVEKGHAFWLCSCECGKHKVIMGASLIHKKHPTQSCGCINAEVTRERSVTHGMTGNQTYMSWQGMKLRCLNLNHPCSKEHGRRGVTICPQWIESFETFLKDVGERPSKHHTIERIDNNGNYEPGNVKWATKKEQGRNRRTNVLVEINGVKKCIAEWAEILGIDRGVLRFRINAGWPVERWGDPVKDSKK